MTFDITHLVTRLTTARTSGIDKVDMAYVQHFANSQCDGFIHYGLLRPRLHSSKAIQPLLRLIWDDDPNAGLDDAYRWLTGISSPPSSYQTETTGAQRPPSFSRTLAKIRWRLSPGEGDVPTNSLYLNVAQHHFEHPRYFRWLEQRPDVKPVFLVHDLLPLDWPEYFRPGYRALFERRWSTIVRHSHALVTTSKAVRDRIVIELDRRGAPQRPVHVHWLPSPLDPSSACDAPLLGRVPYFLMIGTIEPRKNHLLLLNVWRRFAETQANPPKLVIVGMRGWENEQVLDVLDRSTLVRPHVLETSRLGARALAMLLKNARGLLMPSFAEGYGLPIIEALSLSTPIIASDIPVFREISNSQAIFRHPLDGPGWHDAILSLAGRDVTYAQSAATPERSMPTWDEYFASLEDFMNSLN